MSTNVEKSFNTMNLPTWQEIYDIYKSEKFVYDYFENPNPEMDPYWKLPKDYVNIILLVNYINYAFQMNENGIFDDLKFPRKYISARNRNDDNKYPVYQFSANILTTAESFNNINHYINRCKQVVNVYDLNNCRARPIVYPTFDITLSTGNTCKEFGVISVVAEPVLFKEILSVMIKPVIDYFENGIGWKDENGNIISSDPSVNICHSGFDPAL